MPLQDELADQGDGLETIGRKRIICFPEVTATSLRLTVTDTKAKPVISRMSVFYAPDINADIPNSGEKLSTRYNVTVTGANGSPSRSIMIDLKGTRKVKGFRYLPPQRQGARGIITHYSLWAMTDNEWKRISEGEFSNIVNNPIWQSVNISPVSSSLLRIDAESMNAGERVAYEDIEILTE